VREEEEEEEEKKRSSFLIDLHVFTNSLSTVASSASGSSSDSFRVGESFVVEVGQHRSRVACFLSVGAQIGSESQRIERRRQ
jgi:hypothetical protein